MCLLRGARLVGGTVASGGPRFRPSGFPQNSALSGMGAQRLLCNVPENDTEPSTLQENET